MSDDPTPGEIARRCEDRHADTREDLAALSRRVDGKVSQDIYDVRHEALVAKVTALESLRERDAERVAATRRWLIGAGLVPLVGVLLPLVVMLSRGAAS